MNGVIIFSTVNNPITHTSTLVGKSIYDIFPPADAKKCCNVMFLALFKGEPQWCDYTIGEQNMIALIEYCKENIFIIHEAPYCFKKKKETMRMLITASFNYKRRRIL